MTTITRMDLVILRDDLRHLAYVMSILTDRERLVLTYRFGLYGEEPHTLSATAKELGFCRSTERIRQIQNVALNKLKKAFLATQEDKTLSQYKKELFQKAQEMYKKLHPNAGKSKPKWYRKRRVYAKVTNPSDLTEDEAEELMQEWIRCNNDKLSSPSR